jgi:hypothetical protein
MGWTINNSIFSYCTTFKVATNYNPYQLMYGLHPLMSIKYTLLAFNKRPMGSKPSM